MADAAKALATMPFKINGLSKFDVFRITLPSATKPCASPVDATSKST
jgi:hypothetical protein